MNVANKKGIKRVTIDPGEYYASGESVIISTLLGSCVSACLYDPVHRVVGMNHFLLANKRYQKHAPVIQSEAGRYGVHAMELLINDMLRKGADQRFIKAKVFGGGDILKHYKEQRDNFSYVGQVNCRFVKEFLNNERISITASDLGRDYGRVVHFRSSDYSAFMKRISHTQDNVVVNEERSYWEKSLHDQENQKEQIVIW